MSLRKKLNLISIIFTVIAVVIVSLVLVFSSGRGFYNLEEQIYQSRLDSMFENIENEFADIEYINYDWSKWDSTYNFVQGLEPDYVDENMGEDILRDLSLQYLIIYDEEGELVYGLKRNPETDELINPNELELHTFFEGDENTGIVMIEDLPVLYSRMTVTDSDEEYANGYFVFGRIIDELLMEELELKLTLPVDFSFVSTEESGQGTDVIKSFERNFIGSVEHNKKESSWLRVFVPVENSENYLLFAAETTNSIKGLGDNSIKITVILVGVILVILGIVLRQLFGAVVIDRLIELNDQIGIIKDSRDSSQRLDHRGIDEIGELSENINLMLEELEEMHLELSHFATYDAMTGVYNRRVGLDILDEALKNIHMYDIPLSIVYIDIDGLKTVNDRFGHAVGDKMIKDAIKILTDKILDLKTIVRLGGDEFLVILKNTPYDKAMEIEKQINECLIEYNKNTDNLYVMSFSMGTAGFDEDLSSDEFLEKADRIMYEAKQAKKAGRNK